MTNAQAETLKVVGNDLFKAGQYADAIAKSARDLAQALRGKPNWLGNEQAHDLHQLGNIFNDAAKKAATSSQPIIQDETDPARRVPSPRVPMQASTSQRVDLSSPQAEPEQHQEPEQIVEFPSEQIVESPPRLIVDSVKRSFAKEKQRGLLKELKNLQPENIQVDEAPQPRCRIRHVVLQHLLFHTYFVLSPDSPVVLLLNIGFDNHVTELI